jgi:Fe-S oxidoreductase
VKEILDSCLACKGCRAECPSNVDMTRIRAEVLQQIHQREGTPLRSFAVARMAAVERLGHLVRPLYNLFAGWGPSAALLKRILRFAAERRIPALSRRTLRHLLRLDGFASVRSVSTASHDSAAIPPDHLLVHRPDGSGPCSTSAPSHDSAATPPDHLLVHRPVRPSSSAEEGRPSRRVYLFADEFTNYQEAELGLTFARLLRRLGYDVVVPRHAESGRAAISKGCLKLARRFAVRNVRLLAGVVSADAPLVGIEPSCILSFRDEYPDLVPPEMRPAAKALAANCLLFDEFIMREAAAGRISPDAFRSDSVEVWLHGHCHQKALVGVDKTAAALRLLPGATVHVIPSGCCGMAGSFGYEKEHYRRSLEIGEMVLFPAIRRALHLPAASAAFASTPVPIVIVAPGTSCRQQILDGTGARAVHPVELLYAWLR